MQSSVCLCRVTGTHPLPLDNAKETFTRNATGLIVVAKRLAMVFGFVSVDVEDNVAAEAIAFVVVVVVVVVSSATFALVLVVVVVGMPLLTVADLNAPAGATTDVRFDARAVV